MGIIKLFLLILLVLQLLLICYTDIRYRVISNIHNMAIAINTLTLGFALHNTFSVIIPLIALLVGYVIFNFKLIGGGDVKFIVALLFSLSPGQSLDFIIYTAIMGGVVMIIGMIINKKDIQQRGVPYAVAISSGFLLSLFN
ncbi:A24 family peptidase [Yersinia alsatica]|uniref:A24 family peptidase n=1 Tax=Yersinia alsatica TaxID=2890317 RepID=UPI0011A1F488|nr:prepilin peptidase [Yersinia alsatica]